jgi:hypothetical protein
MIEVCELRAALNEVTYRPGWQLLVHEPAHQGPYLSVLVTTADAANPGQTVPLRIHSPIPPMASEGAFYDWLLWRLRVIETHECLEWFRVAGDCWIDPHADISLTVRR